MRKEITDIYNERLKDGYKYDQLLDELSELLHINRKYIDVFYYWGMKGLEDLVGNGIYIEDIIGYIDCGED